MEYQKIINLLDTTSDNGTYIKYVGGFYKFFKKNLVAQDTTDLNISWPSNFFRKYFIAHPINFSLLFKVFRVVLTVTFKFPITKEVNIHNNIKKNPFK